MNNAIHKSGSSIIFCSVVEQSRRRSHVIPLIPRSDDRRPVRAQSSDWFGCRVEIHAWSHTDSQLPVPSGINQLTNNCQERL